MRVWVEGPLEMQQDRDDSFNQQMMKQFARDDGAWKGEESMQEREKGEEQAQGCVAQHEK